MNHFTKPTPIQKKFLTPGVIVLILLALNGLAFLAARFFFGIGAVTNLNNQYPWGSGSASTSPAVSHWPPAASPPPRGPRDQP